MGVGWDSRHGDGVPDIGMGFQTWGWDSRHGMGFQTWGWDSRQGMWYQTQVGFQTWDDGVQDR